MRHFPVATGVSPRFRFLLLLLPLLAAAGGCSLFGVATKGNLAELSDKQERQNQELQARVQQSAKELDGRVTQVEDKTNRINQDLVRYESELQSAKLQLQTIKLDMDNFEDSLDRAATDSRQALRIQHDAIISERDRLRQRLNEIDALILSWEQQQLLEPEGTVTPAPGGLIVPEKSLESPAPADAASAGNETSVWSSRRSGTSSR